MSRLDELPPDQRAALSLLLRQRKSYAEVAAAAGHRRARRARPRARRARRARPAPGARGDRRAPAGDRRLPARPAARRRRAPADADVPERLRAGARVGARDRRGAGAAGGRASCRRSRPRPAAHRSSPSGCRTSPARGRSRARAPPRRPSRLAVELAARRSAGCSARSSRRSSWRSSCSPAAAARSTGKSTSTRRRPAPTSTAAKKTGPTVTARLALHSPDPTSKSVGVVEVLSEGGKRAFFIAAEHLPPSQGFFYAIWLYNSPTSALPLSRSPAVGADAQARGRRAAADQRRRIPRNAAHARDGHAPDAPRATWSCAARSG